MRPDQKRQRRNMKAQRQLVLEEIKKVNGEIWTLDMIVDPAKKIAAEPRLRAAKARRDHLIEIYQGKLNG